jgi:hypothetical protein
MDESFTCESLLVSQLACHSVELFFGGPSSGAEQQLRMDAIHLFNHKILLHFLSVVRGLLPQWQSLLPIRLPYRLVPLLYSVGEIEKLDLSGVFVEFLCVCIIR